jgi:uncharacterized protein
MTFIERAADIPWQTWLVFGQMAPYLLFGFVVAGILSVTIPRSWIERHLSGRGWKPIWLASLVGIPLPLCSCSVIPVSAALRKHGASRGATTSFLLSTPQTGVDSIAVTYSLLGPMFAIIRPLLALITGVVGGHAVGWFSNETVDEDSGEASETEDSAIEKKSCCHEKIEAEEDSSCHDSTEPEKKRGVFAGILHFSLIQLPRDLTGSLLLGVLVAGVIGALVPVDLLKPYLGYGLVPIFVMMVLGIPLYVCATASVPLAVGFLHAGVSPGAVLVFLIVGPATNAATIATLWRIIGNRSAIIYLLVVAISAVGAGLALDAWANATGWTLPMIEMDGHSDHRAGFSIWESIWGIILLVILLASKWGRFLSRSNDQKTKSGCCADDH